MRYKKIGNTRVPSIGQGTGHVYSDSIIRAGIERGLTLIDTAESYNNEDVIGKAIKGQRENVFICDKFLPENNGNVKEACEKSLKRLGTDYIDLYQMYYPNPKVPIGETLLQLTKLVDEGKIKHYGVCNTLQLSDYHGISTTQNEYNLFDRSVESTMPYCDEHNIRIIAYSPLLDFHQLNPDSMIWLQEIGMKYEKSLSVLILNWLISHPSVIAIPRSNNLKHIIKNSQASDFVINEHDLGLIDNLFKPQIEYIPLEKIDITLSADKFPQTEQDAINCDKWTIKPQDVDLKDFKPVKVRMAAYGDYELIEGGLRYWAWKIQKNEPIPCIIKHRWILDYKGL